MPPSPLLPPLIAHPQTCLSTPDGQLDFGGLPEIRDPVTNEILVTASPIRLQQGDRHFGLVHIDENHGEKIAQYYNGLDSLTYVAIVASGFQKVYLQPDRSLFILKFNGVVKSAALAKFCRKEQNYHRVITAYPLERLPCFAKRRMRLIWER